MVWYVWVFIVLIGLSQAIRLYQIDKPRKPLTATDVTVDLIVNGLLIWVLVHGYIT